jgi:T-complex protein 1 subunit gamma
MRSFPSNTPSAGQVLSSALPYLERKIHPIVIISAFKRALEDSLVILEDISKKVNTDDPKEMLALIKSSIGTKFVSQWSDLMCALAYKAVTCVSMDVETGSDGKLRREIDTKRYARIEKV